MSNPKNTKPQPAAAANNASQKHQPVGARTIQRPHAQQVSTKNLASTSKPAVVGGGSVSKPGSKPATKTAMTPEALVRMQKAIFKSNGATPKDSHVAKLQSQLDRQLKKN